VKFRVPKTRQTSLYRRYEGLLRREVTDYIWGKRVCTCERRISNGNRKPITKPYLVFRVRLAGDTADMRETHSSMNLLIFYILAKEIPFG
jgi:hypothetical protein